MPRVPKLQKVPKVPASARSWSIIRGDLEPNADKANHGVLTDAKIVVVRHQVAAADRSNNK